MYIYDFILRYDIERSIALYQETTHLYRRIRYHIFSQIILFFEGSSLSSSLNLVSLFRGRYMRYFFFVSLANERDINDIREAFQ